MASSILPEGTHVIIRSHQIRHELVGRTAEIGQWNEQQQNYECWMVDDDVEGQYIICKPSEIETVPPKAAEAPAAPAAPDAASDKAEFGVGDRVQGKDTGKEGTVVSVDADGDPKVRMDGEPEAVQRFGKEFDIIGKAMFGVGDRVMGKDTGKVGVVVAVDSDGDPKVRLDGETDALQRFGKEYKIVEKSGFGVGDRVRGKDTGKAGTVVSVDSDGDPKVLLDGESDAKQRFAKEYEITEKASFEQGDRVRGKDSGQMGTVVSVDSSGDPKVTMDGESDPKQRYGKDFEIVHKAILPSGKKVSGVVGVRSDSESSRSGGKKKKSKKKKKSSSSSSSKSGSSSSSNKRKSGQMFGLSLEEREREAKRKAKKHRKKYGKKRSAGADAALAMFGLA